MNPVEIDRLIEEFEDRERIAIGELGKRFHSGLRYVRHALFLRGIILFRIMCRYERYYELRPVSQKIIQKLRKKESFFSNYALTKYGLNLRDLRVLCERYGYKLEKVSVHKYRIVKSSKRDHPVPCMQNIEYCAHFNQCYLAPKCAAAQRYKEKIEQLRIKPKEALNG